MLEPSDVKVTARVLGAVKGPKIRIGKYKKRTGYRRHTGFRSSLTQIEIESIGGAKKRETPKSEPKTEPKGEAETEPKGAAAPGKKTPERVKGMPTGYEDMTVAEIKDAAPEWNAPMLTAALEYEQAHSKRKGAIAAVEAAIAAKEDGS